MVKAQKAALAGTLKRIKKRNISQSGLRAASLKKISNKPIQLLSLISIYIKANAFVGFIRQEKVMSRLAFA